MTETHFFGYFEICRENLSRERREEREERENELPLASGRHTHTHSDQGGAPRQGLALERAGTAEPGRYASTTCPQPTAFELLSRPHGTARS